VSHKDDNDENQTRSTNSYVPHKCGVVLKAPRAAVLHNTDIATLISYQNRKINKVRSDRLQWHMNCRCHYQG